MARSYRRNRIDFKNIITIVLIVALGVSAVAVVGGIFGKKNGTTLDFSIGTLGTTGKYKAAENMLYTKESIEFDTVSVTRDFESTTKYKLYFYDKNDNYISCSEVFDESADFTAPSGASRFRVVLMPSFEADEEKVVKPWNIFKYKNEFTFDVELIVENTDDLTDPSE